MNDVVVMAVTQSLKDLSHVVTKKEREQRKTETYINFKLHWPCLPEWKENGTRFGTT